MAIHPRTLDGRSILIIEDEPLIAFELEAAFSTAGASVVSASDTREALRLISESNISAAVVDIILGTEDCSAVCERLAEAGIPFIFYTGDARPDILRKWSAAPILTKLVDKKRMVEVVSGIVR